MRIAKLSDEIKRYPNGHEFRPEDSKRIRCDRCDKLGATQCEYSRHHGGISFWNYCDECWVLPGPDGTIPRDRAMFDPSAPIVSTECVPSGIPPVTSAMIGNASCRSSA